MSGMMLNYTWPHKVATENIVAAFGDKAGESLSSELGYANVMDDAPSFSLGDIFDAFPNAQYLPPHPDNGNEYILDENGKTILLFQKDKNGELAQIFAPRRASELTLLLAGVRDKYPMAYKYLEDIYILNARPKEPKIDMAFMVEPPVSQTVLSTVELMRQEKQAAREAEEVRKTDLLARQEPFDYGWCYTDHKDGKEIRTDFRAIDYVQDEPYASSLKSMVAKVGLPEADVSQFYRGTHHELLFIESHGVVLKIGPTDLEDLIHPAILQPLGWVEDKENNLTLAIYPGIELYKHFRGDGTSLASAQQAMGRTGQNTTDIAGNNLGIMRVNGNKPVQMALDVDNQFNGTKDAKREDAKRTAMSEGSATSSDLSRAVSNAISKTFNAEDELENWMQAFEVHQGLRHSFWKAFGKDQGGTETIDPEALKAFWEECKQATDAPRGAVRHRWSKDINENGVPIWTKYESVIDVVALYTPWTDNEKDRRPKFATGGELATRQAAIYAVAEDPALLDEQPRKYRFAVPFVVEANQLNSGVLQHVLSKPIENKDIAIGLYQQTRSNRDWDDQEKILAQTSPAIRNDPDFWMQIVKIGLAVKNLDFIPKSIEGYRDILMQHAVESPRAVAKLPSSITGVLFMVEAIAKNPQIYKFAALHHRLDPLIYKAVLKKDASQYASLPNELINDRDIYDMVVADFPEAILFAGPDILNDLSNVLDAIELNPNLYGHISDEMRCTKEVLLHHIKYASDADLIDLFGVPEELNGDEDVYRALAHTMRAGELMFDAPANIVDIKDIAKLCLEQNADSFVHLSERLRGDKELALMAVTVYPTLLQYVADELATNEDFLRDAVALNPAIVRHFTPQIIEDRSLFLALIQTEGVQAAHLPRRVIADESYRKEVLDVCPAWLDDVRMQVFEEKARAAAIDAIAAAVEGKLNKTMRSPSAIRDLMMEKGKVLKAFENSDEQMAEFRDVPAQGLAQAFNGAVADEIPDFRAEAMKKDIVFEGMDRPETKSSEKGSKGSQDNDSNSGPNSGPNSGMHPT